MDIYAGFPSNYKYKRKKIGYGAVTHRPVPETMQLK